MARPRARLTAGSTVFVGLRLVAGRAAQGKRPVIHIDFGRSSPREALLRLIALSPKVVFAPVG